MPDVGSRRGLALLWAASTASALASGLVTVAAPLLVASTTSDPLVVSAAFAVAWLPWLLFALPSGVLVDRTDRRRLVVSLDVVRAVTVALLAATIVTGTSGTAVVYAVLFVANACEIVVRSAGQAMVPDVVAPDSLERANGWLIGGHLLAQQLVAGPLGGLLFVLAPSTPFLTAAIAYGVGAVVLMAVPGRFTPPPGVALGPPRSVRGDAVEAVRWLLRHRLLRTMAVLIGLLNLTLTAATAVLVLLTRERLGLGPVGYGVLFGCMAVGGVLGSLLGDRIVRWATPTWTVRVGLLVEAGLHLVLATSTSPSVVGAAFLAFGVHGTLWGIVSTSLRQRLTPPGMLGRVGSTTLFIAAGGNCVGAVLGGVLAAGLGITAPYWIGFVLAVAVSAATWRVFDRRTVSAAYAQPAAPSATRQPGGPGT